jgi:hypothetical protein
VEGLAVVGKDSAAGTLTRLANAPDAPFAVRLSAIRGLPRVVPGAPLADALQPVLGQLNGDVRLRAAASEVLAQSVPEAGCAALLKQLSREAKRDHAHFRKAVGLCKRTP